jgi:hypothetical protein
MFSYKNKSSVAALDDNDISNICGAYGCLCEKIYYGPFDKKSRGLSDFLSIEGERVTQRGGIRNGHKYHDFDYVPYSIKGNYIHQESCRKKCCDDLKGCRYSLVGYMEPTNC